MTIEKMSRHIATLRERVLGLAQGLDRESFLSRKKGMASIRDLLVHLMDAEDYWVGSVILGEKRQRFVPEKYENVVALKDDWQRISARTQRLLSDLSKDLLAEQKTVQWQEQLTFDVETILWHLFTHELHHCGQICLLMREKGYEPPDVALLHTEKP